MFSSRIPNLFSRIQSRAFANSSVMRADPFRPAARVAGQRQDVWSIVNEAAAASDKPIVNMGQGFFGYNPPPFVLDAAKQALDRVECNQYSPTKVHFLGMFHATVLTPHIGPATPEEGHCRRLLALLWPYLEPRHRSHNHHRRQ